MACLSCNVDKLANEFPPDNSSTECDHPSLTCLRCLIKYVDNKGTCPHPGCTIEIPKESSTIQLYKAILSEQFKEYESTYTPLVDLGEGNQYVNVTGLTGESTSIVYSLSMTVDQLKTEIQQKLKHEKDKLKLLYQGKEMSAIRPDGVHATLSDYGVEPNTTICLVICLFTIPEYFDEVVFDLNWGYPNKGTDFLDASCLTFNGNMFSTLVDYRRFTSTIAIRHSGDVMDDEHRIGHHTINVSLKKIPSNITHLFFTLSSWKSPNIAQFPNPSLKFYNASNPGTDLCNTTFDHARNSKAVVMCSVSKNSSGNWEIFESGQLSAGSANDYQQLINTIQKLITTGI